MTACVSPELFAACRTLLRRIEPSHPPRSGIIVVVQVYAWSHECQPNRRERALPKEYHIAMTVISVNCVKTFGMKWTRRDFREKAL